MLCTYTGYKRPGDINRLVLQVKVVGGMAEVKGETEASKRCTLMRFLLLIKY